MIASKETTFLVSKEVGQKKKRYSFYFRFNDISERYLWSISLDKKMPWNEEKQTLSSGCYALRGQYPAKILAHYASARAKLVPVEWDRSIIRLQEVSFPSWHGHFPADQRT